jgi:hypothetical protein
MFVAHPSYRRHSHCGPLPQRLPFRDVPSDELVGDIVEIVADDVRLRADPQDVIPDAPDQSSFPPGRHRAQRVPGMASDKAKL